MKRSIRTRLLLALLIVMGGLAITIALDDSRVLADEQLPDDRGTLVAQADRFFFATHAKAPRTLYLSENGSGWRALSLPFDEMPLAAAAPSIDSDLLYVASADALYVTRSGGLQWERVEMPGDDRAVALTTDPLEGTLYVATEAGSLVQLSSTGGSSSMIPAVTLPTPVTSLTLMRGEPAVLFAATEQGLMRGLVTGQDWRGIEGVPATSRVLASADNPNLLYAATQGGLFRSINGGDSWELTPIESGGFPGSSVAITALTADPSTPSTLYIATANILGHTTRRASPGQLLVSPDGGIQWIPIADLDPAGEIVTTILPEQSPGSGVRVASSEGVARYNLDADRALEMIRSNEASIRLDGFKILSIAAVPTQLDVILPYLHDEDGEVGYYAARALGHAGGHAIRDALVSIVESDADSIVRMRSLLALQMIADRETVPTLAVAFKDDALARSAADALAAVGTEEAWAVLTGALGDEELTPQRQAAMAAFEQHPAVAVQPLLGALTHESKSVRAHAASALGWGGQEAAIRPLRALLNDPAAEVRAEAAIALGELGDFESVARLTRLSEQDPTPSVREAARLALPRAAREPSPGELAAATSSTPGTLESVRSGDWVRVVVLVASLLLAALVVMTAPRRVSRSAQTN